MPTRLITSLVPPCPMKKHACTWRDEWERRQVGLDIMFMVPEIDACLTLAFRNRPDVTLKLIGAFHLFLSQRQSALTVEDRPIPSVSAPVSAQ